MSKTFVFYTSVVMITLGLIIGLAPLQQAQASKDNTANSLTDSLADKLLIRDLMDKWIITSDSGFWDEFADTWADNGFMTATWFQASAKDFTEGRRRGFEKGVSIIHANLGHMSDIAGDRAIAQTKMTISQRATVHGVLVDVLATGRFYDFLEKRNGHWGIVRRQGIYEKDRMDPVAPDARLTLDQDLLMRFPEGYRHLAYLQTQVGYKVKEKGLPLLKGPEVEKLYAQGRAWLAGAATPGQLD